ncbi:centromere protein F isoform X2 [Hemicordylus capensis]|uniref:centromere protein F isoform X2 n=1 Tax=Hemicordylus capensis TaxID=884348 RepID=UPI0023027AC8|nr:centromere protein F isoform X2 [Hemicordylus capensis]
MSWAMEEWKEGLSTRVLQKIQELESQLEKVKKERQQRQFHLESLEAALQKQKQKVENEKTEQATLKRENQSLMEQCDHLEKTRQKLSHDLQVKESQVNFQEGQLMSSNKQIERLEQELKRCKSELERSQQCLAPGDSSFDSTPQKNFAVPPVLSHNDSKFGELQVTYSKEVEERKRLETELKNLKSQQPNPLHPQTTMSRREIARQHASSSVFSWQQEKTPNRTSSSNHETPGSSKLLTSHFPWESGATPGQESLKSAKKDFNNSVADCCKDSLFMDQMKIQNQELRSRIQQLEHNLQTQTQDLKFHGTKLQEIQLQLENAKIELTEKDKALNKGRNEINRITAQLGQTTVQLTTTEEKMKTLSDELNCQRQNSESVRRSLEQKVKEKEKEYQEELNQMKTKFQEELHQAKNNYNLLQAELEKTLLAKQHLEKNASDFKQKLTRADQTMQTMQLKEEELRRSCEEVKKLNHLLDSQSAQQAQEICQLKEEICMTKQLLQQNQNFAEGIQNKNDSLEIELKQLEEKLKKQDNSLTVEKMKHAISDLENQRDSLQQLLKHKEDVIEKLNIKLGDLETLQKVLVECEGLKQEIQILSQWKKENEQFLNECRSEKGGLASKVDLLESALMTERVKSNERVRVVEVEYADLKCMLEGKTTELEAQKSICHELQQKMETSEEKYRKERENNSLRLSEFTKQVDVLQQTLQSAANEVLEKEKCISSLETSLASHVQLNAHVQKQCKELIQSRDEMERKLAKAEQRHEHLVRETEQQISSLQVAVSEKQDLIIKTLAALAEKDNTLQALSKESERQQGEIRDLKINNKLLEDSVHQLRVIPQRITHEEPDLSAEISLNKKEIESLNGEISILKSAIDTLEQKSKSLIQTNLDLSSSLKEREEDLSELLEKYREKNLLLSEAEEELERKCKSLEAKNENLESTLREQASHFEMEKAAFEFQEKQLVNECKELELKVISLEEKNNTLLWQLEKMQLVSKETKSVPIQNISLAQCDGLRQEMTEQNKMALHDNILLHGDEHVIKEMNEPTTSDLTLERTSLEQLRVSVKEQEDELNKYQVKLELLQMDLEDKEVSVENYADQVKQLETVLRTMEIKIEDTESENVRLTHKLQALKDLENSTLAITDRDENDQSSAHFNVVTKDNFNQQIDAKHLSVPHDLMPSQNDYVRLVSSLHMTMSKLNELEKMCEHLQIEKSTLALRLKDSQLEFVTSTNTMAEELMSKINMVREENVAFYGELMDQSETGAPSDIEQTPLVALEYHTGLDSEDLKLSSQDIQIHFDGLKEKILSLTNEYKILHEQNLSMASKISELQCCVEMLKEENTALSTSLKQVGNASFTTQVTPSQVDKEVRSDGKFCMWPPCYGETPQFETSILMETDFDSDLCRPSNKIAEINSSFNQTDLESTSSEQHHSAAELQASHAWVFFIKEGHVIPKKCHLDHKIEPYLQCDTYEKPLKLLEESFESAKNLEDGEIRKLQELLLSAREEVDCLRKQHISDHRQWQQKLRNVILQVASKSSTEKKPSKQELEQPRLQLQDLNQVQIAAEQADDLLCPLEVYRSSSESKALEELNASMCEANGTEDKRPACETERCLSVLVTETRNGVDQSSSSSECPDELSFSPLCEAAVNFLENHRTTEMPPLQIKQSCSKNDEPSCDLGESNNKIDTLLMDIQSLNSELDSKDKELAAKIIACAELNKTVLLLEKEKEDFSEALESVTLENQQLSYNIMTLEIELEKVKSELEMYKVRLSDTTDTLEDLEMTKGDWTEKLLETENELRRIKLERENVEKHALSLEADIEELQSKNKQLEKEKENKVKAIFSLQDQLQIISTERNQLSHDLATLSKDEEELNQMCQKMQVTIKELELSKVDSAEFIRILEAEAKTQTNVLQAAKANTDWLSTEKDNLTQQLQNLEKVTGDLVLEKEAAQSQIEHLSKEKEMSLREYETLYSKLSVSEMEISKISKSLEGSLIEKGELAARLNSAQEEVDQMRRGIEKLKIKIESDEKKRGRLIAKLKEGERKADSLVDKIESLERELQMSEENLEDAIIQREEAKAETEMAATEMDKMRVSLQSLEFEMNVLKSEKERLEEELREEQEKVSDLEGTNSALVKQLEQMEKEEVQVRCKNENALQSQLKQVCEEIKPSHNEQEMKAKGEDLINEVISLKRENTQLVQHLKEAKDKNPQTEHMIEAFVQELQDLRRKLDENDSFLEHLPKNETLQAILEDSQVSCKHPEEELEATGSEKYALVEKADSLKQIVQFKKEVYSLHHKCQHWMKFCREVKQEKELMAKQIQELKTLLKIAAGPSSPKDSAAEEIGLELKELRELVEEKTTEAEENLDKYCALIISHHKLEEENEMLKTQVSVLNAQLKQLSNACSLPQQSPGSPMRITDGPLMETSFSDDITKIMAKRHKENRGCGKEARPSLLETTSEKKATLQDIPKLRQDLTEYESHGSPKMDTKGFAEAAPGNGAPCASHRTDLIPGMSPCLGSPRSPPSAENIEIETDSFPENPKATAEGSKIQKRNDAQWQEMQATGSPLGFPARSPLSACNQSLKAVAGRSAQCPDAAKTSSFLSTEENELDEACHVQ